MQNGSTFSGASVGADGPNPDYHQGNIPHLAIGSSGACGPNHALRCAAEQPPPMAMGHAYLQSFVWTLPSSGQWDTPICSSFSEHLIVLQCFNFLTWDVVTVLIACFSYCCNHRDQILRTLLSACFLQYVVKFVRTLFYALFFFPLMLLLSLISKGPEGKALNCVGCCERKKIRFLNI